MALGEFGSKLMMTKSTQDNSQVISMLSFRLRINKDIINEEKVQEKVRENDALKQKLCRLLFKWYPLNVGL